MNRMTAWTWGLSFVLHALVALPLGVTMSGFAPATYHEGDGNDAFKMEQGISVDIVSLGDAAERVELAEVAPMTANPTPPVAETKPVDPELEAVVTAKESPFETAAVEAVPPPEPVRPEEPAVRDQAAQVAMLTEKSAGVAQDGGKATALSVYAGKINEALKKVKLGHRLPGSGSVVVGVSLDHVGRVKSRTVIKSSGIPAVDRLAVEMVDKASFPPPPAILAGDELYAVPFSFSTRS